MISKKIQLLSFTFITSIFLLSKLIFAVPGIPHQFFGSVTINGNPAPDGTIITAEIDGVEVARTTTSQGKYGYDPVFYIDDPNNDRSGKEIKLFVNGVEVNTGPIYFCNGCVGVADSHQPLDLAITLQGTTTTQPSSTGSYTPQTTTTTTIQPTNQTTTTTTITCQERWVCTEWSECKDGIQTRTCTDENNCGTDLNKPLESQPCSTSTTKVGNQPTTLPITGFFSALAGNPLYYIGILVLVVIIVVLFMKRKSLLKRR